MCVLLAVTISMLVTQEPTPGPSPASTDEKVPAKSGQTAVAVQAITPQRRDLSRTLTLAANISPWYQATLYAKVPGYLKWMGFDKGDSVKKGQLLAVIDAPEVEQQFRQADADYQVKQLTAQRLLNVWNENPDVIAKQDVDVAAGAAEAARHLRDNRRTMFEYTKVTAPFDGIISARFSDPGALIQSAAGSSTQAAPLYTLVDLDTVRVYVSIPQEVSYLAKPGIPVSLNVKEQPAKQFRGAITRTTEVLDPATRTLLVEIDMPNKDRHLQPGMYVTATLHLETHHDVIAIPPAAVITSNASKGKSVATIIRGQAQHVPIKTGLDDGVWVEIVEGLTGNEEIVVVGKAGLTDGQQVKASPYNLPEGTPAAQKFEQRSPSPGISPSPSTSTAK
jgi:RND family efflux transporter MFP subunit